MLYYNHALNCKNECNAFNINDIRWIKYIILIHLSDTSTTPKIVLFDESDLIRQKLYNLRI